MFADPAKRSPSWAGSSVSPPPLAERIRKSGGHLKEVSSGAPDNGALWWGHRRHLEGGRKTFIRDYKIGRVENAPGELYRSQLLFYALAARKHFGGSPLDLALLSLKENREIPVGKDPFSWEDLEEDIASAARQGASGPFEPSLKRCPLCPWKGECLLGREWTKGAM